MSAAADYRQAGFEIPEIGGLDAAGYQQQGTIYVFDTRRRAARALVDHAGPVMALAFAPSAADKPPLLVSAAREWDGGKGVRADVVRLWNAATGECLDGTTLRESPPQAARPALAVWHTGGEPKQLRVAIAWGDQSNASLRTWDVQGKSLATVRFGRQGAVASAHFSPDGHHVVTANWDNTARIWNMQTGKVEYKLVGHSASVNEAVFSPEGAKVLTASDDMTAAIWDARTGNCLVRLKEHLLAVRSAAFSQDGRRMVTASKDKTARIWDAGSGEPLREPGSRAGSFPPYRMTRRYCARRSLPTMHASSPVARITGRNVEMPLAASPNFPS